MNSYRIKGAKDSNGKVSDFFLSNGKFVNENELAKGAEVIDADGLTLLPGFVDLHAHLREPGREDAETVLSGSLAAAAGGFTAISAMPNTLPVADTAGVVEQVYRLGKHHGICDVFPIGAVTVGQGGEKLAELSAMNQSEAGVRIFSDDGYCVFDALVMRRALEYVKTFDGIIAQHAQDPRLTQDAQMNEGEISARLGLKGWPAVAEEAIIARDVLLAEHVDSRLHICHVTTAGGVEIIRTAKKRGIKVSAEVTPHHLLLTDDLAESYDPVYKVNPPLRTKDDVQALREGLADGTIDVIATDHAPHPHESKDCEWSAAAFGMVGLETSFSIAYLAMVETKLLTLSQLVDRISKIPAQIGRYEGHGSIAIGSIANFTLVDLESKWKVQRQNLASKSKNTPFDGMALPGVVKKTFHNGALVYERNSK
ncbi:MAG: dihydroorotase [Actinobacteria bacterium]|nr:dihydroorotase [Actinomycetota bacterium]NBP42536.1 dihydroorotase [Actinomycetota bacterium]